MKIRRGAIDLRRVSRVAYVDTTHPWARVLRLDLVVRGPLGRRKTYRFSLVDPDKARPEDRRSFLGFISAVLHTLEDLAPDTEVQLGETGATRWAVFLPVLLFWSLPLAATTYLTLASDIFWLWLTGLFLSWFCWQTIRYALAFAPWLPVPALPISQAVKNFPPTHTRDRR